MVAQLNINAALNARFNPQNIAAAKQQGWTDDQINAYRQQVYSDLSKQNAVNQAIMQTQAKQQAQGSGGNFFTHLLPSGTGIAGSLGGAAAGAAIGSVVPVLGTGIGALIGGIAGGALGAGGGKVAENAIEGNKDLGSGVAGEALMGGVTGVPLGGALKIGQAGIKAVTGFGKQGVADYLAQAGAKTVPSMLAGKLGTNSVENAASNAATSAAAPGVVSRIGAKLQGAGSDLLGSQANLTRAQARNIGAIPSDVLGSINQRTGLTNIHDMAAVGNNFTGADGAASELVRNAIGNSAGVDIGDLRTIGNNLIADKAPLITGAQKNSVLAQIKNAAVTAHGGSAGSLNPLANPLDAFKQAQNFREMASQLTKGATVTAENKQLAKVYNGLAGTIEGRLNKAPGVAEGLTLAAPDRANDLRALAQNAPNAAQASAYNKLADELAQAKTIPQVRAAQKDFVQLSKIDAATAQAQSGAAAQLGDHMQGLGKVVQRPLNALAIPLNAATPKVAGIVSSAGRALEGKAAGTAATAGAQAAGQGIRPAIIRNIAERSTIGNIINPQQQAPTADANGLTADQYTQLGIDPSQVVNGQYDPTAGAQTAADGSTTSDNYGGISPSDLQAAMVQAVNAGDTKGLANLKTLYDAMSSSAKSGTSKALSSTQQTQVNNAQSGLTDLASIRQMIQSDPNVILKDAVPGGSIARGLTGTTNYDTAKQNIVDVIARMRSGAAITSDEAKRYMSMLPAPGDSQSAALNKIDRLNSLLSSFANPRSSSTGSQPDLSSILASQM